ncbi:excisionase family DNA binding protein [Branchiibius hedensis]|uniref:DNA binding domain-containing protein, excisionase family n=1 Tax=Branchiibius hedensis TaxID=672460 RepID=A0A2Y8ZV46_9MICO|nr:helix-turn-helix domain-containing protein [Branchiibius hedensis]PWJ27004.1 excisionase family DNA binding protein [Branchiibius hedensis]SSA35815.1 DNA binding domain-containing protein, excisionase family [Branchiibius hedensis]
MSTSTDSPRGARKAQTYLPEPGAREEILDFAALMHEMELFLAKDSSKAALIDPEGKARSIPDEIFRILDQVTSALAAGEGITIVPQGVTMTTQQAADFLGISRPTLVRLLEAGDIAYDKPGRHRRVRLEDLIDYHKSFRAERRSALRELQRANLDSKAQEGQPTDVQRLAELDNK